MRLPPSSALFCHQMPARPLSALGKSAIFVSALPGILACSALPTQGDAIDLPATHQSSMGGTSADQPSAPGNIVLPEGGSAPVNEEQETAATIIDSLPSGFTPADPNRPETARGGFKVVGPLSDVESEEGECGNILRVVVRDFQASHDDFENAKDWSRFDVQSPIATSRKPEKTSSNGPLHFEEWYQSIEGVNLPFAVDLWLEPVDDTFVYDSAAFFPLRGIGFQDSYLFTTELHTRFQYQGGELFTFRGDDDVFVFINGYLAVNLSGVHWPEESSLELDAHQEQWELEKGQVYSLDLFQAERQPGGSNFRLETTLDFKGCAEFLPSDVIR